VHSYLDSWTVSGDVSSVFRPPAYEDEFLTICA
jgi:hypothetical protein